MFSNGFKRAFSQENDIPETELNCNHKDPIFYIFINIGVGKYRALDNN